ncbi:MrcB family domain-containing protein [Agromyces sp. Leaf222]|uniref:MrcB family domain-containing protein n=1 Tax=Agromyces sp. Leaf222 TaxID=1735688 RepID=UPI0006FA8597|nr:DUF3578 domain-containing protein [Agromyces sp. Leaf222]KQM81282.1 hypothetical protein ASE68_15960 [Agromyces sp. Leaf222]
MIRDHFIEILGLQHQWSDKTTEAMQQRGILIRDVVPEWFRHNGAASVARGGWAPFPLEVQGKDGIGRKSQVPWVRFYSPRESESATDGWYVVYLFAGDGSGVVLALMHASTHAVGDALIPQDEQSIREAVDWARAELGGWMRHDARLLTQISLRAPKSKVAGPYEKSVVAAFEYSADRVPDDTALVDDLRNMVTALAYLYNATQ